MPKMRAQAVGGGGSRGGPLGRVGLLRRRGAKRQLGRASRAVSGVRMVAERRSTTSGAREGTLRHRRRLSYVRRATETSVGRKGVGGTMSFQTHQRNASGSIGRGPKHEREHEPPDQGAARRRPVRPYVEYVVVRRGVTFGRRLARSPTGGLVEDIF